MCNESNNDCQRDEMKSEQTCGCPVGEPGEEGFPGMEMDTYIGVKLLHATPMTLGEYTDYRRWPIPADKDPEDAGYLVVYPDGYQSWSPRESFESAYLKLAFADRLHQGDINAFTGPVDAMKLDDKTALVTAVTRSGFVLHETSSCVDSRNFDLETGRLIGRKRIYDKVWAHLGFVLQWARFGLRTVSE